MTQEYFDYLIKKREKVLEELKPYCELFGVTDYDYFMNTETLGEVLKLNDTYIGCSANSISAIIDEFIGYIIIKRYCKNRTLGAFRVQTMNVIKQYWTERPKWIDHQNEKGGAKMDGERKER